MSRNIKFRAWDNHNKKWLLGYEYKNLGGFSLFGETILFGEWGQIIDQFIFERNGCKYTDLKVMEYTGINDKNNKEIYEGDIIRYRYPYRTTQTHTGDNIPNGSYTEPMEAAIKEVQGYVAFREGMFCLDTNEKTTTPSDTPLAWHIIDWNLSSIKDAIAWYKDFTNIFESDEDGTNDDITYLIEESKLNNVDELINFLNGIEVIGNVYENKELIDYFELDYEENN